MKTFILFTLVFVLSVFIFSIQFIENTGSKKILESESEELMGVQGTGDNPFAASEFRYNMVTGGIESDPAAGRRNSEKYIKENMVDFNSLSDAPPHTWSSVGPKNIGGRIRSIIVKPGNSNIILIGAVAGGVWKTVNGGTNWSAKSDHLSQIAIGSMVMDPNHSDTVYAGTGEGWGNGDAVYGGGILKSVNFGDTWTLLPGTADSRFTNVMKMEMDSSGNLYAITRNFNRKGGIGKYDTTGGLFKSSDGGSTFNKIILAAANNFFNPSDFIAFNDSTYLLATSINGATYGGLFQTSDRGLNWTKITSVVPQSLFRRVAFAKDYKRPGVAYAVYDSSLTGLGWGLNGIFKTVNYGMNWVRLTRPPNIVLNTDLPNPPIMTSYLGYQGWYDNTIAVDPNDTNKIMVSGIEIMRSTNAGSSWFQVTKWRSGLPGSYSVVHADHHAICFYPNNSSIVFDGNDGGIYKSVNSGNNWTFIGNGLEITQFFGGAVYKNGNTYYGGTQDNGHLGYSGSNSWTERVGGDGGYAAQNQSSQTLSYSEYVYLDMSRTTDGINWTSCVTGLADAGDGNKCLFISPFSMNPDYNNGLIAGSNRVWMTINNAGQWGLISQGLSPGANVSAVTLINPGPTNMKGYAGTTDGKIFRCNKILIADSTNTWTQIQPAGNNNAWVRRIVVNQNKKERVYACYSGYSTANKHVWYSADSGSTWSDITSNLPNVPVHTLAINPDHKDTLYAGTETGVFISNDNGGTWQTYSTGMPPYVPVDELVIQSDTKKLFAFTHGRSVWELTLDTTLITSKVAVKVIIQGFYDALSGQMRMSDSLRLYLRNSTAPYAIVDSAISVLDAQTFTAYFNFSNKTPNGNYYFVLNHRNSLETWSKPGGENYIFGSDIFYDFTFDAAQAYGNNLNKIANMNLYSMYSGDANKDGFIDLQDIGTSYNGAASFTIGYVLGDMNGDMFVDLSDVILVFNNAISFVSVVRP